MLFIGIVLICLFFFNLIERLFEEDFGLLWFIKLKIVILILEV